MQNASFSKWAKLDKKEAALLKKQLLINWNVDLSKIGWLSWESMQCLMSDVYHNLKKKEKGFILPHWTGFLPTSWGNQCDGNFCTFSFVPHLVGGWKNEGSNRGGLIWETPCHENNLMIVCILGSKSLLLWYHVISLNQFQSPNLFVAEPLCYCSSSPR